MTKETFIYIIEQLRLQSEHDSKCSAAFKVILPNDYTSGYDNTILSECLLKLVKDALNDNHRDSWIEYYVYELEFGAKYRSGCAKYKNGKDIDISTPEKLYDFLIKEMKNK
jgi:hypothetical protein